MQLRTRTPVMDLDAAARTAKLGREEVGFGQALLATGAGIRRLQAEGGMRDGIHYLRALGNADKLRNELDDAQRVVVVGGSYIATEVAASMVLLGKQVTLVMQEQLPLERHFGPVAGAFVRDLLAAHGIEIVASADVAEFAGEGDGDARVEAVVCADGRRIETDLVVAGVGAQPDVMLARKAELALGETGGVACDRTLRSSAEGIFAAGDMCEYDSVVHGRRLRVEHEEVAAAQGRHAARAMLGSAGALRGDPLLLVRSRRLGDARVRRPCRGLGRGDRPRRPRGWRVQHLLWTRGPDRGRARRRPAGRSRARPRADRLRRRRRRAGLSR